METTITENDHLKFIYLKEYLENYFIKNEFIFICDKPESILANCKFNRNTVSLTSKELEENIRFEDSCYPEYLFTIITNSGNGNLIETIKATDKYLKGVNYPKPLIRYKLLQLFEIILYRDFNTDNWWDKWTAYKCYVVKRNGELEYYTIYDFPKLLEYLLDWVTISHRIINVDGKNGYKLVLDFNATT